MQKLVKILSVSRPVSWVNTAFPFLAGALITGSTFGWTLLIGFFFFLFPYNVLMYGVNDIFDYESDKNNPRKNSIEGAVVRPGQIRMLWIAIVCCVLPLLVILLALGNLVANIWLLISLGMVLAYSVRGLRFKEKPVLDSFTSSWHFWSPLVYAVLLFHGDPFGYWQPIVAFVFWGMASHALGAIQDILYDREGKIASVATYFGAKTTSRLVIACYITSIVLVLQRENMLSFASAYALSTYVSLSFPALRLSDASSPKANVIWRRFISVNQATGFCLTVLFLATRSLIPMNLALSTSLIASSLVHVKLLLHRGKHES